MKFGDSLKAVALSGALFTGSEALANDNIDVIQTMNVDGVITTIEKNTGTLTIGPSDGPHVIEVNSGVLNIGGPADTESVPSDIGKGVSIGENHGIIVIQNDDGTTTVIEGNGEEYTN